MLGATERPEVRGDRLIPVEAWGLKAMSMGFLVEEDSAMIWRGPMIMGAVQQFLGQVDWGDARCACRRSATRHRRYPAHAGPARESIRRGHRLDAAGYRADRRTARRAHVREGRDSRPRPDRKYELFLLPELRPPIRIFSAMAARGRKRPGSARLSSAKFPFFPHVRALSDAGTPVVATAPESEGGRAFIAIAAALAAQLQVEASSS